MNRVYVQGLGAVSPAGWGIGSLCSAVQGHANVPVRPLARPGWEQPLWVRPMPAPSPKPAFLSHARFRRSSAIAHYVAAAALEAIGVGPASPDRFGSRLGLVICLTAGCVTYSRRLYEEILEDPVIASPILFPETVFNAPASHLAAYLGVDGAVYTLVGDNGAFLQGLALAATWLAQGQLEACVVVGAEEVDWVVADALRLFKRDAVLGGGAGALYLGRDRSAGIAELNCVTDSFSFVVHQSRQLAASRMRAQLPPCDDRELLCLGTQKLPRADAPEADAWEDWSGLRLAPKETLGEAFTASAGWQCVIACDAIRRRQTPAANVSVVGINQQAIGARFVSVGASNGR